MRNNIGIGLGVGVRLGGYVTDGAPPVPPDPTKFNFTLAAPAKTSASVYDGNDVLLRTLWDGVDYTAGNHVETWNQLDNEGNSITGTYGVDWRIDVQQNNAVATWNGGIIGNTSSDLTGPTKLRSFTQMTDALVLGNKLFNVTGYAEGVSSAQLILMDDINRKNNYVIYNGEDVYAENQYMCSNGTYIFYTGTDPFDNSISFVYAAKVSDLSEVTLVGGSLVTMNFGFEYNSCISIETGGVATEYFTGLAVNDTHLFVFRGGINEIQIIELSTGTVTTNATFTNPRSPTIIGNTLWMINGTADVKSYTISGTTLTPDLTLSGLVDPITLFGTPVYRNYLNDNDSDVSGYKVLDTYQPNGVAATASALVNQNNVDFVIKRFATDLGNPGITSIPASTWAISFWYDAFIPGGFFKINVYKRTTGGTETLLTTLTTGGLIAGINNITASGTPGALTIAENERLVFEVIGRKTGGFNLNMTLLWNSAAYPSQSSFTPIANTIAVIDGGTSQQVKGYDNSTGATSWTLGDAGGYENGPAVTDYKLYFDDGVTEINSLRRRPFGMFMLDGTFWILDGGNERFQHYDTSQLFIERIGWLPHSYSVQQDPNNPNRVWNEYLEFDVTLATPTDWTLTYNWRWRVTADFYVDYKGRILQWATEFPNGETYAQLQDLVTNEFHYFRLDTSTGLVSTGRTTDAWEFQYIAPNGNLYKATFDTAVGATTTVEERVLTGYTALAPDWAAWATVATFPINVAGDPTTGDSRATVVYVNDGAEFGLYENGTDNEDWHWGLIADGGTTYKAKSLPSTYLGVETSYGYQGYFGEFPTNFYFDLGNQTEYPGGAAFSSGGLVGFQHHGEFWKLGQTNKLLLISSNNMLVLTLGTTSYEAYSYELQAPPEMAGNAFSGNMTRVVNNLYYVHNDEGQHSAVHFWTVSDLDTISVQTASLGGTLIPEAGIDILADLPFRSVVTATGNITRSPASDSFTDTDNYWNVQSGRKTYTTDTNDIYVRGRSGSDVNYYVDFDITPNVTTDWTIWGNINWDQNQASYEAGSGAFLQVLDSTGKVIAQMVHTMVFDADNTNYIECNDTSIFSLPQVNIARYTRNSLPFEIIGRSTGIDFDYDGNTLTGQSMQDGTADWSTPTTLRINFITTNFPSDCALGLLKGRYDET
jgi:hypothetical protein